VSEYEIARRLVNGEWVTGAVLEDSGGGGAALLLVAPVTLDDEQIKALPTTPPEIVESPGPGFAIMPLALVLVKTYAALYTNVSSTGSYMVLSDEGDNSEMGGYFVDNKLPIGINGAPITYHTGLPGDVPSGTIVPEALTEDSAIYLYVDNSGDGDFTGGDPSNTMKVVLYHMIVPLA
jgi:hypothetical protein